MAKITVPSDLPGEARPFGPTPTGAEQLERDEPDWRRDRLKQVWEDEGRFRVCFFLRYVGGYRVGGVPADRWAKPICRITR